MLSLFQSTTRQILFRSYLIIRSIKYLKLGLLIVVFEVINKRTLTGTPKRAVDHKSTGHFLEMNLPN